MPATAEAAVGEDHARGPRARWCRRPCRPGSTGPSSASSATETSEGGGVEHRPGGGHPRAVLALRVGSRTARGRRCGSARWRRTRSRRAPDVPARRAPGPRAAATAAGSPTGGVPVSGRQHADALLPGAVGDVERRQVADEQGDDAEADGGLDEGQPDQAAALGAGEAEGEQRRAAGDPGVVEASRRRGPRRRRRTRRRSASTTRTAARPGPPGRRAGPGGGGRAARAQRW